MGSGEDRGDRGLDVVVEQRELPVDHDMHRCRRPPVMLPPCPSSRSVLWPRSIVLISTLEKSMFCCAFAGSANATWSADDQDDRGVAWVGQFGTTSAPRWPHFAHTKPSPSDLIRVWSGRWPTFMIVLCLQRP